MELDRRVKNGIREGRRWMTNISCMAPRCLIVGVIGLWVLLKGKKPY